MLTGSPNEYRGLKSLYGLAVLGDTLYGTDWYQENTLIYSIPISTPAPVPNVVVP